MDSWANGPIQTHLLSIFFLQFFQILPNLPSASAPTILCFPSCDWVLLSMGNKPVKEQPVKEETVMRIVPPLDRAYVRWLARDIERIHRFTPKNPQSVRPPDHYIEYMRLNGWLDLDLNDPDLARLFKGK